MRASNEEYNRTGQGNCQTHQDHDTFGWEVASMTDPFHDWRNLARPCTWQRGYYDQPHVKAVNERIQQWNDGLLTMRELVYLIHDEYQRGYTQGREDAHYQVPAVIYTVQLEDAGLWQYIGQPDDIRSSYPTYWRKVKDLI